VNTYIRLASFVFSGLVLFTPVAVAQSAEGDSRVQLLNLQTLMSYEAVVDSPSEQPREPTEASLIPITGQDSSLQGKFKAPAEAPVVVGAKYIPPPPPRESELETEVTNVAAEGSVFVEPVQGGWPADTGYEKLFKAIREGEIRDIAKLLDEGVPLNARDPEGKTPLFIAIESFNPQIVTYLIKRGADVNATTNKGWGLLHHAALVGQAGAMFDLIEAGANPGLQDNALWTPLHVAVYYGFIPVVRVLLQEPDIKLNAKNKKGYSALSIAAAKGYLPMVNLLAQRKDLNLNVRDPRGRTALHLAARKGITPIAQALLILGADSNIQDGTGKTALELAESRGHRMTVKEIKQLLR